MEIGPMLVMDQGVGYVILCLILAVGGGNRRTAKLTLEQRALTLLLEIGFPVKWHAAPFT